MIRTHRSLAWTLILALLCASLATLQPPSVARAADFQYVVDNALDTNLTATPACTSDAKDCSLRQAILKANADSGTSQIVFDIPADDSDPDNGYNETTGLWTIHPLSSLPALAGTGNTEIVGRNDNAVGTPRIVIDGAGINGVGLRVTSGNNTIRQLIIVNFQKSSETTGIGIRLTTAAATKNQVFGNYIGNFPGGTTAANQYSGIQLDTGANDNTIGLGSSPGDRNVISGNVGDGIRLSGAPNNKIYGNYIGLGLNASFATLLRPNQGNGIDVIDSSGNQIGGTLSTQRNVVSGNALDGIVLTGEGSTGNTVAGNYIGLSETGATDLGNTGNGVTIIDGASGNSVFGTAGTASVIAGNGGYGVLITDTPTSANQVYRNYIGLNAGGNAARKNDKGGVLVRDNASNNQIGLPGQGNTISGNGGYGVAFGQTLPGYTALYSNTVAANLIGLNALGTVALENTLGGVLVGDGANSNAIGGTGSARNVIAGNGGAGVTISGTAVLSNTVVGNLIGLRRATANGAFTTVAGNKGDGVLITAGAKYTRVGGSEAEGNTIAGNDANGVHVSGAATTPTSIRSNYIGVVLSGESYLPAGNGQNGVAVDDQAKRVSILGNHISRNTGQGIALSPNNPAPGGDQNNANHDIDPPFGVRLNQERLLTGRVLTSGASDACALPCTIQIFSSDPSGDAAAQGLVLRAELISTNGYFTTTLSTLYDQLAITATDKNGNTSEFAQFDTTIGPIDLAEADPNAQSAIPGQVVTYTHQLINNGSVDLLDLKVAASSSRKWQISTSPPIGTPFALAAGQTKLLIVTLKLPLGPDTRVLAGPPPDTTVITVTSTKYVTVTDSATDTTTVLPKVLIDAQPTARTGFGVPDTPSNVVRYTHRLVNKGNIATTVQVQTRSLRGWTTEVSTDTIRLEPGDNNAKFLTVSVTVPSGTAPDTAESTFIDLIVPDDVTQNRTLTDTTIAQLNVDALLLHDGDVDGEGGAGEKVTFFYTVENRSTGTATFSLEGSAALGSRVTFRRTDGGVFGEGNSFTISNQPNSNTITFAVEVLLDNSLLRGQTEVATILLLDDQGRIRQAAQNQIYITHGLAARIYLPYITNPGE